MLYFAGLTEEKAIKDRYKELAKKHHPDLGGCVEAMKEINNQYEQVITGCYQSAGKSITEIDELLEKDASLREALMIIIGLVGIEIEICGSWLWITGDTLNNKEALKACKFFWSANKKAWYWRPAEHKSYNRNKWSLDQIRTAYGSKGLDMNKIDRCKIT